ncbi:helix-turn-helix domain-containing protein, partial [Tsukamurella sputi]
HRGPSSRRRGHTLREIANQLNRSASTISRELRRNHAPDGTYRPFQAHRMGRHGRRTDRRGCTCRSRLIQGFLRRASVRIYQASIRFRRCMPRLARRSSTRRLSSSALNE